MITVLMTPVGKMAPDGCSPPLVSLGNEWQRASRWQVKAKAWQKKKKKEKMELEGTDFMCNCDSFQQTGGRFQRLLTGSWIPAEIGFYSHLARLSQAH